MSNVEHTMTKELSAAAKLKASLMEEGDEELTRDMMEGETDLREIIESLMGQIEEDSILLDGIASRQEQLDARKRRLGNRVNRCRALIEQGMSMAEIKTLELAGATLTIKTTAKKVIVSDEAKIPTKFWKAANPTLDKTAVKTALQDNEAVPGASLSNGGIALQVRMK